MCECRYVYARVCVCVVSENSRVAVSIMSSCNNSGGRPSQQAVSPDGPSPALKFSLLLEGSYSALLLCEELYLSPQKAIVKCQDIDYGV